MSVFYVQTIASILTPNPLHSISLVSSFPQMAGVQLLPGEANITLFTCPRINVTLVWVFFQGLCFCSLRTRSLVFQTWRWPTWPTLFGDSPSSLQLLSKQTKGVSGKKQRRQTSDGWVMDDDGKMGLTCKQFCPSTVTADHSFPRGSEYYPQNGGHGGAGKQIGFFIWAFLTSTLLETLLCSFLLETNKTENEIQRCASHSGK